MVKQTDGAIGYIELAYAMEHSLNVVALKNDAGEFVLPTTKGVSLSAKGLNSQSGDIRVSIVNAKGSGVYPISAFTYILLQEKKGAKNTEIKKFLAWAITKGQSFAEELHYAPLPSELVKLIHEQIK